MPNPSDAIGAYIRAKDGNRPHVMRNAFAEGATLEMVVKTDAISFPPSARGCDAITDILVRRFSLEFENVYTFCLASPVAADDRVFSCDWMVGMSSRESGEIRIGCGCYDWFFQIGDPGLAERLKITVERMRILPPDRLTAIMNWLSELPYPWCPAHEATWRMPRLRELTEIADHIRRDR